MLHGHIAQVQTTFVEENGGRAITNTIATGQAAFFPKGLVHYQYNTSCKPAKLLAALGHEDFGVQTVSTTALANLPSEGLAAALGITQAELTALIAKFPANPAQSAECVQRCTAAGSLPAQP
jgi:oxalate decarboxylase/phosphoglucose isomerase-like protein (cupin superfamily)